MCGEDLDIRTGLSTQANLVVNGRRVMLFMMSCTCTDLMTEFPVSAMNEQTLHRGSLHSGALRLEKSDRTFAEPARCLTLT